MGGIRPSLAQHFLLRCLSSTQLDLHQASARTDSQGRLSTEGPGLPCTGDICQGLDRDHQEEGHGAGRHLRIIGGGVSRPTDGADHSRVLRHGGLHPGEDHSPRQVGENHSPLQYLRQQVSGKLTQRVKMSLNLTRRKGRRSLRTSLTTRRTMKSRIRKPQVMRRSR